MTPAVTANALIRFARVEMSTSARIGYPSEEKAYAAGNMLNRVNEWAIDFHFNRRRRRRSQSGPGHHGHGRGGGGFRSLFVHRDKGFVKNLRDIEVIPRCSRRHSIEIGASPRLIECGFHSERLELFC